MSKTNNPEIKTIVVVSGGVFSSLGKGILSASISSLLNQYRPFYLKLDPYLNIDAGMLNPNEHGEVFVTGDGHQSDLDLGTLERFTFNKTSKLNNFTGGQWIQWQLQKSSEASGKTIRLEETINSLAKYFLSLFEHIMVLEWGGSIDDVEAYWIHYLLESLQSEVRVFHIHLTPLVSTLEGEYKTKPIQSSLAILKNLRIKIQALSIRCDKEEDLNRVINKVRSFFVGPVIPLVTFNSLYLAPSFLKEYLKDSFADLGLHLAEDPLIHQIGLKEEQFLKREAKKKVLICNKYSPSSKSVYQSLFISLENINTQHNLDYKIENLFIGNNPVTWNFLLHIWKEIKAADKIILPGGFGQRGWSLYKLIVALSIREGKHLLGICWGSQAIVCSLLSSILPFPVDSEENNNLTHAVPIYKKGDFWLGNREVILPGGLKRKERFRNRYHLTLTWSDEVKNLTQEHWENNGLLVAFRLKKKNIWATQFHPEFSNTIVEEQPILVKFLKD